jgi:exodeoxyribonuclease VII large subunit
VPPPAPPEPDRDAAPSPGTRARPFTVSDLNALAREALEARFSSVFLVGEISNFKAHGSGHWYFSLKDERAQIGAAMFRYANRLVRFRPSDGMKILLRGSVGLYEPRGQYQIVVETMEPVGLGELQAAFEQLKGRLRAEGLFDEARKRPLPRAPRTIGIVTALQGAAVHDMLRMLRDRWPAARVVVRPARVQGPGAAGDVAAGIADVQQLRDLDVVIVGRGGGSLEDLWAFNEETVARAIATCRVPVVSAVGHEVDFTIADFAADVRAPTPTAAAALVVPDRREIAAHVAHSTERMRGGLQRQLRVGAARIEGLTRRLGDPRRRVVAIARQLDELATRSRRALVRRVAWDRRELGRLAAELARHGPRALLAAERAHVTRAADRMRRTMEHRLHAARADLEREAARLDAFSPLACLARGYAIVRRDDPSAAVVRDAATLAPGDGVRIVLARGRVRAHIDET